MTAPERLEPTRAAPPDRPSRIDARPVRHPWRWVVVGAIVVLVAMMLSSLLTNPRWELGFALQVMNYGPVLEGLWKGTIFCTVGAMVIGVGLDASFTFFSLDVNAFSSSIAMGAIGLGLSEAAYMAEIARAGILSVDPGQAEAAKALGMSPGKTTWRIVLPQAMRVIVPPTGNETIAMVKDTSLLTAVPVVANRTFKIMPSYVAAVAWYIVICSVLMVGQRYLERRFGRGFGSEKDARQAEVERLVGAGEQH